MRDVSPGYGRVAGNISKTTKSLYNQDILEIIEILFRFHKPLYLEK